MTRLPVELHPEAGAEARDARRWYAERDAAAAATFLSALDRAIHLISQAPDRWPAYLHGTRRVLMRRFPFCVIYPRLPDRVLVVAVAHERQKPGYWQARSGASRT